MCHSIGGVLVRLAVGELVPKPLQAVEHGRGEGFQAGETSVLLEAVQESDHGSFLIK